MKRFGTKYLNADDGSGSGGAVAAGAAGTETDGADKTYGGEKDKTEGEKKDGDRPDGSGGGRYTEEDIAKLKAEHEKHLLKMTAQAAEEALKKANMKPDEKAEYERNQKQSELERRETEAALRELRIDALDMLTEKQLDKGFLDFVIGADKDGTAKKIDALCGLFDKAVQTQVEIRLKGKTPNAGNPPAESDSVRNAFRDAMGGY